MKCFEIEIVVLSGTRIGLKGLIPYSTFSYQGTTPIRVQSNTRQNMGIIFENISLDVFTLLYSQLPSYSSIVLPTIALQYTY